MIILILGENKDIIEKICFITKKFFKYCVIVHPLYFLEFKEHKNIDNLKNIYCFKRVKTIIKNNEIVIIDNYINSVKAIENLIYNINLLGKPITHFICDKSQYKKFNNLFDNIFLLKDFNNFNLKGLKNYIKKEYKIIKNIIHPKKIFITILSGSIEYRTIFTTIKRLIRRVSNNKDDLNKQIDVITNRKINESFFLMFVFKKILYLFNLQNFTTFIINFKDLSIKNCLLLKINNKTSINKLDFIVVSIYLINGKKIKKTSFFYENNIIRIV